MDSDNIIAKKNINEGLILTASLKDEEEDEKTTLTIQVNTDNSMYDSPSFTGNPNFEQDTKVPSFTLVAKTSDKTIDGTIIDCNKNIYSVSFNLPVNKLSDYYMLYNFGLLLNMVKFTGTDESSIKIKVDSDEPVYVPITDNHNLKVDIVDRSYFDRMTACKAVLIGITRDDPDYDMSYDVYNKFYKLKKYKDDYNPASLEKQSEDRLTSYYSMPVSDDAEYVQFCLYPVSVYKIYEGKIDMTPSN